MLQGNILRAADLPGEKSETVSVNGQQRSRRRLAIALSRHVSEFLKGMESAVLLMLSASGDISTRPSWLQGDEIPGRATDRVGHYDFFRTEHA